MSVCGTPACSSSQAVSRAPWRYGRVSSTQTWSVAAGVVRRPGRRRAPSRTGRRRAARCCSGSGRAAAGRRGRAAREPGSRSRPWSSVASETIALASSRMRRRRSRRRPPTGADRVVARHHPVDRPAQVDRGRPRGRRAVRRAPGGSPGGRTASRPRGALGRERQPDRRDLADRRARRGRPSPDRVGRVGRRRISTSTSASGSCRWSITSRTPSALQRNGVRKPVGGPAARRPAASCRRRRRARAAGRRVEDRAGRLGRRSLERLGGARRPSPRSGQLARELAEEPAPGEVADLGRRRLAGRASTAGRAVGADVARRPWRRSVGIGSAAESGVDSSTGRQYRMTLVTRRPSSRSRPLRNSSSTRNARPTTSPLSRSTSSIVPWTVPPVASRSSTISTFWPGLIASRWISSVFEPYSSAYSTVSVSAGSLPSLRTGTRPALEQVGHRGAEDEAARLHADDDVDPLVLVRLEHQVDRLAVRGRVLEQRRDVVEEDARAWGSRGSRGSSREAPRRTSDRILQAGSAVARSGRPCGLPHGRGPAGVYRSARRPLRRREPGAASAA